MLATPTKTQIVNGLIAATPKKGKMQKLTSPTMKTKLTGDSNHLSLISLNVNGFNSPLKRHRVTDWIRKQNPSFFCIQEISQTQRQTSSQSKGLEKNTPIEWT